MLQRHLMICLTTNKPHIWQKEDLDLADILAGELNKSAKDQKVAFFLDSDELPNKC